MSYGGVITLLHRLGYVQCDGEKEMFKRNHLETLKKVYQFWEYFKGENSLERFLVLVCAIEKVKIDYKEVTKAVGMFVNYLCKKSVVFRVELPENPEYRFIVNKWSGGEIDEEVKKRIVGEFREFRVNRLNCQQERREVSREKKEVPVIS